jgi:hypothetical protein
LARDSLSSEGFLRRGETKDALKWAGRRPVARECIEVIVGIRIKRGIFFEEGSRDGVEVTLFIRGLME